MSRVVKVVITGELMRREVESSRIVDGAWCRERVVEVLVDDSVDAGIRQVGVGVDFSSRARMRVDFFPRGQRPCTTHRVQGGYERCSSQASR